MSQSTNNTHLLPLPAGWHRLAPDAMVGQLAAEVHHDHALSGVAVESVAARGANDDVLFRHVADPSRFTVVHLTWSRRREPTPHFPSIEFDGTFAEFLECERRLAESEGL